MKKKVDVTRAEDVAGQSVELGGGPDVFVIDASAPWPEGTVILDYNPRHDDIVVVNYEEGVDYLFSSARPNDGGSQLLYGSAQTGLGSWVVFPDTPVTELTFTTYSNDPFLI